MVWVKVPLRRAAGEPGSPPGAGTSLTVGKYQLDLDNTLLHVSQEAVNKVLGAVPVHKTWQDKAFTLNSGRLSADGTVLTFDFQVTRNPLPLAVVLGGLGVIGAGVVLYLCVKELRRLMEAADLTQGWGLAAMVVVLLCIVGVAWILRTLKRAAT